MSKKILVRKNKDEEGKANLPAANSGFVEKFAKLFIRFGTHVVSRN